VVVHLEEIRMTAKAIEFAPVSALEETARKAEHSAPLLQFLLGITFGMGALLATYAVGIRLLELGFENWLTNFFGLS
jgi:hypothetical protein